MFGIPTQAADAEAQQQAPEGAPAAPAGTAAPEQGPDQLTALSQFMQSEFAAQFDDPAFRKSAMAYDAALNKGQKLPEFNAQGMYEFATRLFSRELKQGVGDKLPDGSTVDSKRIVTARQVGDNIILELDITATKPTGEKFDYRAPVTKNRTSEDTDEVLRIPMAAIRDRVRGAKYLAQAIEQAGGREQIIQQMVGSMQGGQPEQRTSQMSPQLGLEV